MNNIESPHPRAFLGRAQMISIGFFALLNFPRWLPWYTYATVSIYVLLHVCLCVLENLMVNALVRRKRSKYKNQASLFLKSEQQRNKKESENRCSLVFFISLFIYSYHFLFIESSHWRQSCIITARYSISRFHLPGRFDVNAERARSIERNKEVIATGVCAAKNEIASIDYSTNHGL